MRAFDVSAGLTRPMIRPMIRPVIRPVTRQMLLADA